MTELRLIALRDQLDTMLDEATRAKLSYRDLVALICRREIDSKLTRRISRRFKYAHFPMHRELDDFDFSAQPSVDEVQFRELESCRWINHGDNILLLGPPGVGKTHLAIGLGRAAIHQDYDVKYTTSLALAASLSEARDRGTLDRVLHHRIVIAIRGESYRLREKRQAGMVPNTASIGAEPADEGEGQHASA